MSLTPVEIATDGACKGNPGPGGWGALIAVGHDTRRNCRAEKPLTTNNRMELMAAIEALKVAEAARAAVTLSTDSRYVMDGLTKWIKGWQKQRLEAPPPSSR